ncbi:MAG: ATP-binding protein [Candidatus Anaerobiospirillum merdipullorum]|uniref:ATP-binding protein n=1 Tax=Candidatus Anaerobiospirillum merdipullorum TaxID=2838450 RepID=A0A9E2KMU7_9GAMM|nr:ATP-binding protein [Candidatus Anaerobiospirillum merdipullorum]
MLRTVKLPATINILGEINAIIEQTLPASLSSCVLKTQLVVEELLANICSYAYNGAEGCAEFACGIVNFDGKKCIMIQLTDEGMPYDPFAQSKAPDLEASVEDRAVGGLGVFLVKEIATHYLYMRIDNRNQAQIILSLDDESLA